MYFFAYKITETCMLTKWLPIYCTKIHLSQKICFCKLSEFRSFTKESTKILFIAFVAYTLKDTSVS